MTVTKRVGSGLTETTTKRIGGLITETTTKRIAGALTASNTRRVNTGSVTDPFFDPWGGSWGSSWGMSWIYRLSDASMFHTRRVPGGVTANNTKRVTI